MQCCSPVDISLGLNHPCMEAGALRLLGKERSHIIGDVLTQVCKMGTFPYPMLQTVWIRAKGAFFAGNFAGMDLLVPRVERPGLNGSEPGLSQHQPIQGLQSPFSRS